MAIFYFMEEWSIFLPYFVMAYILNQIYYNSKQGIFIGLLFSVIKSEEFLGGKVMIYRLGGLCLLNGGPMTDSISD